MKHSDLKISYNYANAWFAHARNLNILEEVYKDCLFWKNILQAEPIITIIFSNPICQKEKKKSLFDGFSGDNISEISKSVFYLMNENKRAGLWNKVLDCFIKIYLKYKNIVEAQVVTSKVFDNKSLEKMREVVKKVFSCDDAILKNVVDPKIIGGFVLTSSTERYDKSLCSAFESLKKKLTNI